MQFELKLIKCYANCQSKEVVADVMLKLKQLKLSCDANAKLIANLVARKICENLNLVFRCMLMLFKAKTKAIQIYSAMQSSSTYKKFAQSKLCAK